MPFSMFSFIVGVCAGGAAASAVFLYVLYARREYEAKLCGMLRMASRSQGDVLTTARVLAGCAEWDEYNRLSDLDRWKLEDSARRLLRKFRVYIP